MSKLYKNANIVLNDEKYTLVIDNSEAKMDDLEINYPNDLDIEAAFEATKDQMIENARKEAERIVEDAQLDANQIIAKAEQSSETIVSDAYGKSTEVLEIAQEEGYQEGYQKGFEEGRQIAEGLIEEAKQIKESNLENKRLLFKKSEQDIIELVLGISEKILNESFEDKERILKLVDECISRSNAKKSITIHVSDEDFLYVESMKDYVLSKHSQIDEMVIKKDYSLEKASCVVETDSGCIDNSISAQLDEVRQSFTELLKASE